LTFSLRNFLGQGHFKQFYIDEHIEFVFSQDKESVIMLYHIKSIAKGIKVLFSVAITFHSLKQSSHPNGILFSFLVNVHLRDIHITIPYRQKEAPLICKELDGLGF
jgi:hypothetical protein